MTTDVNSDIKDELESKKVSPNVFLIFLLVSVVIAIAAIVFINVFESNRELKVSINVDKGNLESSDVKKMEQSFEASINKITADTLMSSSESAIGNIGSTIAVTTIFFTIAVVGSSVFQFYKIQEYDKSLEKFEKFNEEKEKKINELEFEFNKKMLDLDKISLEYKRVSEMAAHINYGVVLQKNSDFQTAIREMEKHITFQEEYFKDYIVLKNLAIHYLGLGLYTTALCYEGLKKYNEADFNLGAAINVALDNELKAKIYLEKGKSYFRKGNYHEAQKNFNEAKNNDEMNDDIYYNEGLLYKKLFNIENDKNIKEQYYEISLYDFNEAISKNANHCNSYLNRGILKYENGVIDSSLEDFKTALKIDCNKLSYCTEFAKMKFDEYEKVTNKGSITLDNLMRLSNVIGDSTKFSDHHEIEKIIKKLESYKSCLKESTNTNKQKRIIKSVKSSTKINNNKEETFK